MFPECKHIFFPLLIRIRFWWCKWCYKSRLQV